MSLRQQQHPFRASLIEVEASDEFNLFGLFADPVRIAALARMNQHQQRRDQDGACGGVSDDDIIRPSRRRRLSLVEALNNGSIDIPQGSNYFFVDNDSPLHSSAHHSQSQHHLHIHCCPRSADQDQPSAAATDQQQHPLPSPSPPLLLLLDMPRLSRLPPPPAHLRPGKFPVHQDDVSGVELRADRHHPNSSYKRRSRSQPGTRCRDLTTNTSQTTQNTAVGAGLLHEPQDFIDEDCTEESVGVSTTTTTTTTTAGNKLRMNRSRTTQDWSIDTQQRLQKNGTNNNGDDGESVPKAKGSCCCSQDSGVRSSTHSAGSLTTTASSSGEEGDGHSWGGGACCSASSASSSTPSGSGSSTGSGILFHAEAVWEHVAMLRDELPFRAGEEVAVLDCPSAQLWYGVCGPRSGWFPASYVRPRNKDLCRLCAVGDGSSASKFDPAEGFPSPEVRLLRRRIVQELISTEREYVRLLQHLVQGFVEQCRRRRELFPEERVQRIFGNLEMIQKLHTRVLRELYAALDEKEPEQSMLANVFLRNSQQFGIYTDYCNNRTVSCTELACLDQQPQFLHFFEACRLLRGMPALSLDSVLLTPVQRICRYPLQLLELLKATPAGHPDRLALELAQRTMRQVAAQVNDGKRRVDAIQKIWLWQKSVHGFRGPDLVESNHRMLINGELHCRALWRAQPQWAKSVQVYLFDQSIVLCRRDVLRRSQLVFKERMSLQGTSVQDLHDGKDPLTGASLKNAFKLVSPAREYIFSCPDPATKGLWLEALRDRPRPQPPTPAERRLAMLM